MTQRKLLLRALAVALLFGLIFWLVDSLAYLHYFGQNLRRMMFEPPQTLLDAVLLSISAHTLFVRLSFLITCLIGGWLAAHYMNRQRKSEERLRQVVENMPVLMDAFDEHYNITTWNRECERVTGYRAEELIGAPLPLERLYPDAEYRQRMIADQARLGSDFRDQEWTLTCKDGTKKTLSWSNISARVPIPGWYTWAIGVDVTERVQAQHRITHLNAVLRAIRNVNQLIVREKDPFTLIERTCHLLTETRGYQHAWIALVDQRQIVSAVASAGLDHGFEAVREHFRQDEQVACIQHALAQSGAHCIQNPVSECPDCPLAAFYQGMSSTTIRLEHAGMMYGVLSVTLPTSYLDEEERALFEEVAGDIALALHGIRLEERRKQAETALQKYSETLEEMVAERTRELRETQEKLLRQERLAALGQLAGSLGHELRTPLATIANAVYYLKMVTAADDAAHQDAAHLDALMREYLDIIGSQVRKGEKIIADLLDFSRVRSLSKQNIQVAAVVALALEKHDIPTSIEVTTDIPEDLPVFVADPTHIEQVLTNLITNACHAMPDGGALTISAQCADGMVAIDVRDTGSGITPEHLDTIFEPLFTTKARGIGLGLAVCKNLVEANNGRIEVTSEVGQGSTFTIFLPIRSGKVE